MTRTITMAACIAALTLSLVGCTTRPNAKAEPFELNSPRVELIASRVKVPVTLDGVLSPQEWSTAKAYPLTTPTLYIPEHTPPKMAAHYFKDKFEPGTVRFLYDAENLYVGVQLEDSSLVQFAEDNGGHLYQKGDLVEVFIKGENTHEYWELYGSPNNLRTAFFFHTRGFPILDKTDECTVRIAAKVNGTLNNFQDKDKGWSIEFRIPRTELAKIGLDRPGNPITVLVARYNYTYGSIQGGPRYSTLPKLPIANYHATEYYGKLLLQ
ncbi:MAG: carbohydrate-binding family 9-like protein [Victivallales bacterium]|nr:carbohydrate-binding family 9-like protein [Victivallales bacterium]